MHRTFERINDLCVKTMIAAESEITPNLHLCAYKISPCFIFYLTFALAANFRTNCYELFGCDIMLDSDLNPHLLEVGC